MDLRYGLNPQQSNASAEPGVGTWPFRVVNGTPSYINLLDALNAWQLVSEAGAALGQVVAASFKHVSPAGVAIAGSLDEVSQEQYGVRETELSPVARAYLRARDADPKSSYGDFVAVSQPVDMPLAEILVGLVSDGVIAPSFEPGVIEKISQKKGGSYLVLEADSNYVPPSHEAREVFGVRLVQERDPVTIGPHLFTVKDGSVLTARAIEDLILGLFTLKYTQSNSVCYVRDGMTLGIGAGQQSRVDCTRLAGSKVDLWWLRRHPRVRDLSFRPGVRHQDRINWQVRFIEGDLSAGEECRLADVLVRPAQAITFAERAEWSNHLSGVAFVSDGYLPFSDNVEHASRHGVEVIAEPGGSARASEVENACSQLGITLVRTGLRLFHH